MGKVLDIEEPVQCDYRQIAMRCRLVALVAVPTMISISSSCGADASEAERPTVPSSATVPGAATPAPVAEDEHGAKATSMSPAAIPEASGPDDNSSTMAGGMDGPVVFRAAASDSMTVT